jgi:hypothetical protein
MKKSDIRVRDSELKLGIMQPYFLPYIGYFQLIAAVDIFIIYDNIKYTKKGWINRNRFLQNDKDVIFSLPLKKDSDSLCIRERMVSADFNRKRLLDQLNNAYRQAPYFEQTFPLIKQIIEYPELNLFIFLQNSIQQLCKHLEIFTKIIISSEVDINHELQAQNKVLALCNALGANSYVNPIGGLELYEKKVFFEKGIKLNFIKSLPFEYEQFHNPFVPFLSIMDVLMFNSSPKVQHQIKHGHIFL